ncbi:MAG: NAD(P)H-binding protein [Aquihabitans sp.]
MPPTDPSSAPLDLVTGAFGNTGSAIADRLLDQGRQVRTLTGHPPADPDPRIELRAFNWGDPERLAASFDGVTTFYNTYWMRTGDDKGHFDLAVDRCNQLIQAAETAGVERIVHLSVGNPSLDSPYPYFRGKAQVEQRLAESPIPAAVIRPSLIFGGENAMLNDLAWVLKRLPVFAVPGDGQYMVRPVHLDDVVDLCLDAGTRRERTTIDAIGPDRFTYQVMIESVRDAVGAKSRIVHTPAPLVLAGARVLGAVLRAKLLTRDELLSTIDGIADAEGPATGSVSFFEWLPTEADDLGVKRA